jgi:DNA-directed RNA polymerase specialized sigma24 family protein
MVPDAVALAPAVASPSPALPTWAEWEAAARPIIRSMTRDLYTQGMERADWDQELWVRLWAAFVRGLYDPAQGPLTAFIRLVLRRQVCTLFLSQHGPAQEPRRRAVSLDAPQHGGRGRDGWGLRVEDRLGTLDGGIEEVDEDLEAFAGWSRGVFTRARLTGVERAAFAACALGGATYEQFAAAQGISEKTVDNALQRARAKLAVVVGMEDPAKVPGGLKVTLGRRTIGSVNPVRLMAWDHRHPGLYLAIDGRGKAVLVRPEAVLLCCAGGHWYTPREVRRQKDEEETTPDERGIARDGVGEVCAAG